MEISMRQSWRVPAGRRAPKQAGRKEGSFRRIFRLAPALAFLALAFVPGLASASEMDLVLPDLGGVSFGGLSGRTVLFLGMGVALLGLAMGIALALGVKRLPTHRAMLEISDLIYETCKTYLATQGKFILQLQVLVGVIIAFYFGYLRGYSAGTVAIVLLFSLLGIAGSWGVAALGMRINTWANSRAAFASLQGKPYPTYSIPLRAGMSIGMSLISIEILLLLTILLLVPSQYAGACFIGFAVGSSLGASALRIAGGIVTKIA